MTKLTTVMHKQGLATPSTDEEWAKYQSMKDARRRRNVANAEIVLRENAILFKVVNKWIFLLTPRDDMTIEYQPAIGQWDVNSRPEIGGVIKFRGYGVRNLVQFIKELR